MLVRLTRLLPILGLGLVLAAFSAGCGAGEKNSGASTSATPSPVATSSQNIRALDLANQPDVKEFVQGVGGEVLPEEIIYADLTGDGLDDAVIPVSSGGTQGDVAFIVVGYVEGGLGVLFSDTPAGGEVRVTVSGGMLVESLPVYSQGDQPHFPSHVKKVYYVWKGDRFAEDHQEIVAGQLPPA